MYLTVLSMARGMIAQWEDECISLSVLSVARVMIAQWEDECISLSVLSMARVIRGVFSISYDNSTKQAQCKSKTLWQVRKK